MVECIPPRFWVGATVLPNESLLGHCLQGFPAGYPNRFSGQANDQQAVVAAAGCVH